MVIIVVLVVVVSVSQKMRCGWGREKADEWYDAMPAQVHYSSC